MEKGGSRKSSGGACRNPVTGDGSLDREGSSTDSVVWNMRPTGLADRFG